ncbi:MAG: CYTH domain-containing protein [Phycisphaerales bacterium]
MSWEPHKEIERKYLLTGMPALPGGAVVDELEIDQGYYFDHASEEMARVRRVRHQDGRRAYYRTVKRGSGLVREEFESDLTRESFEEIWPQTIGRRIQKTRFLVRENEFIWEIDRFEDRELVLAEVELETPETIAPVPQWVAARLDREVTEEREYTNMSLAR